jgi:glutaminase
MKPVASVPAAWASSKPPLLRFLDRCYRDFSHETGGAVADYIPELGKADPDHFGIGLATLDGHVYEVGDTRMPFTIQSMSKPFVFALALDTLGAGKARSASNRRAIPSIRSGSTPTTIPSIRWSTPARSPAPG